MILEIDADPLFLQTEAKLVVVSVVSPDDLFVMCHFQACRVSSGMGLESSTH